MNMVVLTLDCLEVEIETCLKEKQSLRQVIDELEKKFNCKLSDQDGYHVEEIYIDILINLWLKEGLQLVSITFDPSQPLKSIEVLKPVCSFSECCNFFGTSNTYNVLISDQSEVSPSLKSQEKKLVCELKKQCFNDIFNRTSRTKNEMAFVMNFVEALKSFKDLILFCKLLKVGYILGRVDENSLQLFLSNLLETKFTCPKLRKLKTAAKKIYNYNGCFLIGELSDIISAYIDPVVIKESNADGRSLLEVSGKHIVISNKLEEIEKSPRFSHIEEVRFVGAGVVHIDADLPRSIWHGKNIVVYGETVIVSEDKCVVWDVSGKDADFTAKNETAGVSEDGCGLKGEDGSPGESGGNVCIIVDNMENGMNFTIVSNGGKGSKGQNGGSGKDGVDGKYIDAGKFKKDFPPVSHMTNKKENYLKTIVSVCQNVLSVDKFHYGLNELDINKTDFNSLLKQNKDLKSIYFETTTVEGFKIQFSFYNEDLFSCCQSFLLHKGALGAMGQFGGTGGCGGKGGFPGDVTVHSFKDIKNFALESGEKGADGKEGVLGSTGKPGRSGLDRGYMDCTLAILHSLFYSVKWPKVFTPGPSDINKLTVKYYNEKKPDRVKCPHNGLYAEVTEIKRLDQTELSQRNDVEHSRDVYERQEIQAKRKKTINKSSIVEQYRDKNSILNICNIENDLKKVQGEMEKLIDETAEETEQITQEAKMTRQISYSQNAWYLEEIKHDIPMENNDYNSKIEATVSSKRSTKCMKPTPTYEPSSKITEVSLSKYHLDMLESIYDSISHDHILEKTVNMKSQSTKIRFLVETETCGVDSNVNQGSPLHMVEQFFCQNSMPHRQEVVRLCNSYSLNDEPLQKALKSFIHEFDNDMTNKAVVELAKRHNDVVQMKELRLKDKLLPLKNELLSKAKNRKLYNHLINGVLQQSTQSKLKFENEITQDQFLSYLYRSFVNEIKKPCDWEMEHVERNLRVFREHMIGRGPFGTSFREFLAQHFDVNILLYSINKEDDRLVLLSNHNPKARSEIHFLLKRDTFVKLNFDYEFARLFEKYKHLGNALNKIMHACCSFTDKKQMSDYVSKSPFTCHDYAGLTSSEVVTIKINHILNQDSYVKNVSNSYVSQKDIENVKCSLQKLTSEFIGYENILHYMALHFEVEGNQTPANEMCFVINQILKLSMEESNVMSLMSWIIAAQPQQKWVLELVLLKLELYYKRPLIHETKLKWRQYIEDQIDKNTWMMFLKKLDCDSCQMSVDNMEELLHLLGNVPRAHIGLESVNLSEWKYHLKDRFWAHLMRSITNWSEEQLKTLSFYAVTWENSLGMEVCMDLVNILKEHANEIETEQDKDFVLSIMQSLNSKEFYFSDELWKMLRESKIKDWNNVILNDSINTVSSERTLQQLLKLIQKSGNTSENISKILPSIEKIITLTNSEVTSLKKDLTESMLKRVFTSILSLNKGESTVIDKIQSLFAKITPFESMVDKTLKLCWGILNQHAQSLSFENITNSLSSNLKVDQSNDQDMNYLCSQGSFLPFIELCVGLKHKKWLRNTQKLTAMTFLLNAKKTLAQVSTGEGKSLIVVTTAISKALCTEKVNIVTSSKVLAQRDATMYKDIYEVCGLTVGHNCSESIEERKKVYSNCNVIYGDLANFQRDYLLDRVYQRNILGDGSFETVIVDEVDSMLLDKGNNVLYLSHDIPGLDKLEPVFFYIWKWISRPLPSEQFEDLFNIQAIKEKIIYEMVGVISKENLKQLDTSIAEKQVDRTWDCLVENEVINHKGKVLKGSVNSCNIDALPDNCIPKIHLEYILDKVINREKVLNIPKYLHSFVEDHLENWIKSGVNALVMENGRDYIVDVDRSGTVSDRNPIITILDRDTGTDLVNSQWDDALHQFLQLKHGCKLSLLTLKAVFISNVSYLKLYKTLYGLTGTLGSKCERKLLQEVYDVEFVTIPTAKVKKFSEVQSILCSSKEDWKQNIYEEVNKIVNKNRSALIICETIKEVMILKEKLAPHFCLNRIHTYTRDREELKFADDSLQPGNIIISTNLAGRGTDIKLSEELIANGGLYVCLTFLPSNYRVEEQAYGRAARNGEPGTGQLIFRTTRQSASHTMSQVIDVKKQRNIFERKRLEVIKLYHETQILQEEKWFGKFREVYDTLSKMEQKEDVKFILLQILLNQWAFWLDKNKKLLISTPDSQEMCISLENFVSDWKHLGSGDLKEWLTFITDPSQLVKLGLAYFKHKEYTNSLLLFNKVIEEEPDFSESAHYYTVCVNFQQLDLNNTSIVEPLQVAAKKIKQRAELLEMSALEINWLKEQDNLNVIQIDSFLDQQRNICSIYEVILKSIYDILGKEILPEDFVIPSKIEKHIAKDIYDELLNDGLLTKPIIKSSIKSEELLFVKRYGLSPNKMNQFLSKFEGKEYQEQQFLESFMNECLISSREHFWEELVNNKVLANEEMYVFIDMHELHLFHPSLCQRITPKTAEISSLSKTKIWLYQPEELLVHGRTMSFIKQDELIQLIGWNMYQLLEKKKLFVYNKSSNFDPTKLLFSNHFDAISKEDFHKVNICEETASTIIEDLTNQQVIKEKSSSQPGLYYLLTDAEHIEHIELTTHKAYTSEVRSLMSVCFAYRIAFEKLKLLTWNKCDSTIIPLQIKLHERIVFELKEKEIITKAYVEKKADVSTTLNRLYPELMSEDGFKKLLSEVCCDMNCDSVVKMLIDNKWLICKSKLLKSQDKTYYINSTIKSLIFPRQDNKNPTNDKNIPKPQPLPQHFAKDTITKTILRRLLLIENLDHVTRVLKSSKSLYFSIETPSFSLTPLIDVLLKGRLSSEIETFALNGFDQLIILEEKKWTWRAKWLIGGVVVGGVCQIVAGAVLEVLFPANPIGLMLLAEGKSDLMFAVSCMCTGLCSLKQYLLLKVASMAVTVFTQGMSMFASGFGQNACGLSFRFIKDTGNLGKTSKFSAVVKNCSVRIATAISQGVIYAAVDHVAESNLDKLSLTITEAVHSNIDEAIDNHSVTSCITEICGRYGLAKSKTILSVCFSKHLKKSKDMIGESLSNTVTSILNLIKLSLNKVQKSKNKTTTNNTGLQYFEILELCGNVTKAITECRDLFTNVVENINEVLDAIEEDLSNTLLIYDNDNIYKPALSTPEEDLKTFTSSVCDDWKTEIKNQLSDALNENLLSPALQYVSDYLVCSTSKFILKNNWIKLRNDDVRNQNVIGYKRNQAEKKPKSNSQTSEYEECLLGLLMKKRNVALYSEIMRKNFPIDTHFIEMCCFVLPKALQSEGFLLPNLEIIVERNGTCKKFSLTDKKGEKTTIIIAPESDLVSNVFKNKTLINGGVDLILTKVAQNYPVLRGYPIDFLRSYMATAVEKTFGTQPYIPNNHYELPCENNYFKINALVEHKFPSQHFHVDGKYVFNMNVDVDLRREEKLSFLSLTEDHIFKGFACALDKINNHIQKVQDHLRHFRLSLGDFEETNYEIVPRTNESMKGNFHCFATHYKLTIPLVVELSQRQLEDFTITMSLNNIVGETMPYAPCGPHITYEIRPTVHLKYLKKGVKGHVLINKECSEYIFSVKNCHIAGDLILPTGFKMQKTFEVLIVGDTMFETVPEVASYPNFVALSYANLNYLKSGVASLSMFYKVVQCVVLIPGVSTLTSKMSAGEITMNIAEVVGNIQAQFGQTKIVVCSVFKVKGLSGGKVTQTNKCLKLHLSRKKITFLETNSFISSDELEDDGIHLNRRGLNKILKYVLKM